MKTTPDAPSEHGEYDFDLPDHLIATYPPDRRGDSRLLVVQPGSQPGSPVLHDLKFEDLPGFLRAGDLLITNDTRVSHRRVRLQRSTGGNIEALFLNPLPDGAWLCLVRGLKKLRPGETLYPQSGNSADFVGTPTGTSSKPEIAFEFVGPARELSISSVSGGTSSNTAAAADQPLSEGNAILRPINTHSGTAMGKTLDPAWQDPQAAEDFFERHGEVPIPDYLGRGAEDLDRQRYQTVYARRPASVAAPTAGLHFTDTIIEEITQKRAEFESLELRIGYGTFAPLSPAQFRTNRLHTERYSISENLASRLNHRASAGASPGTAVDRIGRRIAVGTTTLRALEANQRAFGTLRAGSHYADLFLRPPDKITTVDALVTNFHLPGSSLVMLVACMLDRDDLMVAYRHAIRQEYRFFSYGDAMLVCGPAFCS